MYRWYNHRKIIWPLLPGRINCTPTYSYAHIPSFLSTKHIKSDAVIREHRLVLLISFRWRWSQFPITFSMFATLRLYFRVLPLRLGMLRGLRSSRLVVDLVWLLRRLRHRRLFPGAEHSAIGIGDMSRILLVSTCFSLDCLSCSCFVSLVSGFCFVGLLIDMIGFRCRHRARW